MRYKNCLAILIPWDGYRPTPCGYENDMLYYNWGEWEEAIEFLVMAEEEEV